MNDCEWLFSEHRVVINGLSIPLHSRSSKCTVRRIYAARESEHTER